ncbi:hypothetical protein ACFLQ2_05465 [archaeon]
MKEKIRIAKLKEHNQHAKNVETRQKKLNLLRANEMLIGKEMTTIMCKMGTDDGITQKEIRRHQNLDNQLGETQVEINDHKDEIKKSQAIVDAIAKEIIKDGAMEALKGKGINSDHFNDLFNIGTLPAFEVKKLAEDYPDLIDVKLKKIKTTTDKGKKVVFFLERFHMN